MKKKLLSFVALVALAVALAGCGARESENLSGDFGNAAAVNRNLSVVVVYTDKLVYGQDAADWWNSLVGRKYNGRPITEIISIATYGDYGYGLYALVRLG